MTVYSMHLILTGRLIARCNACGRTKKVPDSERGLRRLRRWEARHEAGQH